ncbi:MAG: NAD-dependent epimerase/dehydratase family protein [Acidobacteria bacterium]|nr:NAD-dependent epimerase/dehydratase family protein [Acidobacteriota bacterium]
MKVLLTGGTGFLGGRVAETLAAAGHQVALLARRPEAAPAGGFEVLRGDVEDGASLAAALAGREAVVHCAALVKRWVKDPQEFDRVNVQGLDRLLDAAWSAGAGKVLYCSSFIALGPTDGRTGDEDNVHDGAPRNDYERTKLAADRRARERQARGENLVVVYPGVVYGPGRLTDGNILAGVARDLLAGKLPGTVGPGDRRQCLAQADDVARGFLLALERAPAGSRYVLGGENLTVREALGIMAEAGGVKPPARAIPYGVASALGRILRWQAPWTGIEPMMTDGEVEIYRHEWAFSSARAARELGYTVTPARAGLAAMVRWLIESGHARVRR